MAGTIVDIITAALLFGGLTLATIGLYGLLRMRDVFHQLHPAGLVCGPALLLVLLAAIGTGSAEIITSAALVFVFLLVTSSLSNHAIANAAWQVRSRGEREADDVDQPTP
jgi:monovalent cation/proton antiporter MnhG/PhaG subunit